MVKFLNMLLTGFVFMTTAYYARQATVSTQTAITDLMNVVRQYTTRQLDNERPSDVVRDDEPSRRPGTQSAVV